MASSTIRKALGAVKDQTSISIAKVAGNVAPDLEVLIVKATSHDDEPPNEKYISEILHLLANSRGYVNAFVVAISKRLSKTRDWIVALKALMLVHRLLVDGDPVVGQEIIYGSRRGLNFLHMSGFRDEAHSNSWDHSGFVRSYALYLEHKLEFMAYERKSNLNYRQEKEVGYGDFGDDLESRMNRRTRSYDDQIQATPIGEMKPERVLERLNQLLRVFDRVLACRPNGAAKSSKMVLVALSPIVKESFRLYVEVSEVLVHLLDRFNEMEYVDSVKAFDAYVCASKRIDELVRFYGWAKEIGVARTYNYPDVLKITDKLLGTLEGSLRERATRSRKISLDDTYEIKALPPPENNYVAPPPPSAPPPTQPVPQPKQVITEDLVNLKDGVISAEDEGNKFALALFSGPPAPKTDGSWEAFPEDGEPQVTSAWQTPAAEIGKADWELALVESASNLSKQKADMGGGLDSLLLNGMYDQGTVRQHVSNTQISGGSSSSVAMPGFSKGSMPVLALPAPDGTVQAVGHQDPFAASLAIPPPSYVQISDMERKQQLLLQEQHLWQQYGNNGMQGQVSLAKLDGGGMYPMNTPYGMGQPGGYYYYAHY